MQHLWKTVEKGISIFLLKRTACDEFGIDFKIDLQIRSLHPKNLQRYIPNAKNCTQLLNVFFQHETVPKLGVNSIS